jgi:hypothetical protein
MPAIKPFIPVLHRPEDRFFSSRALAATQTFLRGAVLTVNGSNAVAEGGTNPAAIAGIALAAAADYDFKADTFGTSEVNTVFALNDQTFRGTLLGTFALADIGAEYGLTKHTNDIWVVDKSKTTTNARVKVLSVDDGTEVGEVNPTVTFVILPANRQLVA